VIVKLRDPYNGAETLFNLDKFIHAHRNLDGGYELIFEHTRVHMDYKEYERFTKAIEEAQKK